MISVANNGIITMNAGDTLVLPLFIDCGKYEYKRYKLRGHDKVYFSICEPQQEFNKALIRKIYTKKNINKCGDIVVVLDSSDTENVLEGIYYYEVKIKHGNGAIQTIVPRRKFIIL